MQIRPGVLRTPDERFAALPEFPFQSHYAELPDPRGGTLRMAYVDEGPRQAPVALMLHGEPTWSYLYRKPIAAVAAAGYRAVAPDLIGFGRSDKPLDRGAYTYQAHVDWLRALVETLDLRRITLLCQDWGGPIGLRVLAEQPQRFAAVLAANTLLPNCEPPPHGIADWPGAAILAWSQSTRDAQDMPIGAIVNASAPEAYDAPFPEPRYKAGPLEFPALIPVREELPGIAQNRRAWAVLERFERPFRTAFSDGDPFTKPWEAVFQQRVPGARGQPHAVIRGAGHFLQEEQGEALAQVLLDLMRSLP
ncbi:MAG: alpha/beta fold hydrolase [Nevskia sp.]|nr:alpha/beta fold hydrolase [Nevskia sp.]